MLNLKMQTQDTRLKPRITVIGVGGAGGQVRDDGGHAPGPRWRLAHAAGGDADAAQLG